MALSRGTRGFAGTLVLALATASEAFAGPPPIEQALALKPIQIDVEYDIPAAADIAKCQIAAETIGGGKGWVVRNPQGQMIRRFIDSNGDNVVDLWCYYHDGIEVYRDVDSNFNNKADQYRWLNVGGTRWGVDENEDGKIDLWKTISPEEVSAEVVRAIIDADADRFARLLLTSKEITELGLGADKEKDLTAKVEAATKAFREVASAQKVLSPKSTWLQFAATRPGVVPAGTEGSTRDLVVYENSVAVADSNGKNVQVQIGTLVQVPGGWKLAGLPEVLGDEQAAASDRGYFFQTAAVIGAGGSDGASGGVDAKLQELLSRLEKLDKEITAAGASADLTKLNNERADVLEQLVTMADSDEDRNLWRRQLADTMSAAVQACNYPEGVDRLKQLFETLKSDGASDELMSYVRFRQLTAEYGQSLQAPNADFPKVQEKWLADLEQYVTDYPKGTDTAEALLQLAMGKEFAGQEEDAKKYYGRIASDFASSSQAPKAKGAQVRIDSVGKPILLKGQGVDGKPVDLAKYLGKLVLVQYWATWCEPCKADMAQIKELQAKYGKQGFTVIGVNLDTDKQLLAEFLKQNKLPWANIHEPGGLDGRLANELGIVTLPTMLLVDEKGKVVDRNIYVTQLENELKTRFK